MQTLTIPFAPISSGWAALNSDAKLFPILEKFPLFYLCWDSTIGKYQSVCNLRLPSRYEIIEIFGCCEQRTIWIRQRHLVRSGIQLQGLGSEGGFLYLFRWGKIVHFFVGQEAGWQTTGYSRLAG